jgi:hypothetical protein
MKRLLTLVTAAALLAGGLRSASAAETNPFELLNGFPAFATMRTTHAPIEASIMGATSLFYEIQVVNAYRLESDVVSLGVSSPAGSVAAFSGGPLERMFQPFAAGPTPLALGPGTAGLLFVQVPFASAAAVPATITNTLTIRVPKIGPKPFAVAQRPLAVDRSQPVVIEPPFRGTGWFAGSGPSNDSGHRRTYQYLDGQPYFAQRFAIDWLQGKRVGDRWLFSHGDVSKNANWYCYGTPLLAVADGVVVGVRHDLPDNVPLQKPLVTITKDTIGGNFVVLDIGHGRYAFYAHMQPNSARVKVGDHVRAGQVIGLLGNSGNSSGPHLHFHIVESPSFLFSDGLPYAFRTFTGAQSVWNDDNPEEGATVNVPFKTYTNTMPSDGAIVNF